jgi:hypothetical protein
MKKKKRRGRSDRTMVRSKTSNTNSTPFGLGPELAEAYAEVITSDSRYKIAYLIPHEAQDLSLASPFGWYTPGIHEAAGPLRLASVLPADIREPYTSAELVLISRLTRRIWPIVAPIELNSIVECAGALETPFQIFFTNDSNVANLLDPLLETLPFPTLHFSTSQGKNRLPYRDATATRICTHVKSVMSVLNLEPNWKEFVEQARGAIAGAVRKFTMHPLPMGFHNVVAPNELALIAFGRKLTSAKRISQPGIRRSLADPAAYVSRICRSVDAVSAERSRLLRTSTIPPENRLVLAVASSYWGIFKRWRAMVREADPSARKGMQQALATVVQAKTYFDRIPLSEDGKPDIDGVYAGITRMRALDLSAFTSALTLLSTKSLVPVIRLEPKLSEVRGPLKQLASCIRTEGKHHHWWKVSRQARAIGSQMRQLVDRKFLDRIDAVEASGRIEGIKLVSDLPLELLPTRGVPLGLRFDTSRLSSVPGNQLIQNCISAPIRLPLSAFREILVIRSFKLSDSLREIFKTAVESVCNSESHEPLRIKYRFVDIESSDEFVDALNHYNGAILVFDGHGRFNTETGVGSLVVGDEVLDAWSLSRRCVMPPIVMFSACDTHPIDGSHGSVAMAAFNLGARAVLGTLLPINGISAGVFNARLALRIEQFVPLALRAVRPGPLTWRAVVSGMLRMSHTVEVLRQLANQGVLKLSADEIARVQLAANLAINQLQADWYSVFESELAACVNETVEHVRELISKHAGLTDAMKYVHLGNPENIVIVEEAPYEIFERLGQFQKHELVSK